MRAVTVSKEGGQRRLVLTEHAEPQAKPDEVIVSVKAISLNNGEVRGSLQLADHGYRPGWDLSGIVQEAPAGSDFARDDRVVGVVWGGGWAERVAVPMSRLAKIPDGLSLQAASTLPVAGLTAVVALEKKPLGPESRVLVTAATGGVGIYAIQLAAETGAHVTAFARHASQVAELYALGATHVAVGSKDAETGGPYDLILEGVGGALLGEALMWLAPRGVCVLFGDASEEKVTTFDSHRFRLQSGGTFGGTMLYGFFLVEELGRPERPTTASVLLADLARRLAEGRLRSTVGRTAPWTEIDVTARALLKRGFPGKAVLTVG